MTTQLKSLTMFLTDYVQNVFKDVKHIYCVPSKMERDKTRLIFELVNHGSRVLTLDLPALGKAFDKALSVGKLELSGLFLSGRVSKAKQYPAFLSDLFQQVFTPEGVLRDTPSVEAIMAIRTLLVAVKKIRLPFTERSAVNETKKFLDIELDIPEPSLNWGGVDMFSSDNSGDDRGSNTSTATSHDRQRADLGDPTCLGHESVLKRAGLPVNSQAYRILAERLRYVSYVSDIIATQFGDFSQEESYELPKHGPGVTADKKRFSDKYAFTRWPAKLDAYYPYDYYATPDLGMQNVVIDNVPISDEEIPSRLIAVPKTQKGPRLIAAEPVEHQWIQQLIRSQLEARLSKTALKHSIFFKDQSHNGNLALQGSKDGSYATIDLSSASDRLSCYVVERVFRRNQTLLTRLNACRTSHMSYSMGPLKGVLRLKKFASMGSAVTFPVQSIVYAIFAVACILHDRGMRVSARSVESVSRLVSVFGDDIIVPSDHARTLVALLEQMGLRVNPDKTFMEGNFRESCGVDAWEGVNITPPYLLAARLPKSALSIFPWVEVSNNFFSKGFWNVATWLDSLIEGYHSLIPILKDSDNAPIARRSFSGDQIGHLRTRFNKDLQRVERRVLLLRRKTVTEDTDGVSRLLKWFLEKPLPDIKWSGKTTVEQDVTSRPGWYSGF